MPIEGYARFTGLVRLESEAFEAASSTESRMDEGTFREFYLQTAPKLRAYIRRACGDAALADDLLQESFYRFLRANLSALEQWQLKAYLYRVANSLLADHWRRVKREKRWRLEQLFGETQPVEPSSSEGEAMRVFRKLKPREQLLLWLAYVEGFDHREIALALQLNEKSVRVLLFRARKNLGDALRQHGFGFVETRSRT